MPHRVNHLVGGRYRIHTPLGSGGMGSVYQATDETLGREVAVKVFREVPEHKDEWMRQEREIRLLSTLNHPGLISLHDAGVQVFGDETRPYLVMELVSDPTLDSRMAEGALSTAEVGIIGGQIAEALAYVHSKGVVHRDVKPANILINDTVEMGFQRVAKLIDFGIANVAGANPLDSDGKLIGTVNYLSPEQAARQPVTASSDVYSLGLVLLEALTGRRPFPGSAVESIAARLRESPEIPETLPPQWRDLLRRMTEREPEKRPKAATVARVLRGRSELVDGENNGAPVSASSANEGRSQGTGTGTGSGEVEAAALAGAAARSSEPRQSRAAARGLSGMEAGVLVTAVGIICWLAGVNTGTILATDEAITPVATGVAQPGSDSESDEFDVLLESLNAALEEPDGMQRSARLEQLEQEAQEARSRGELSQAQFSAFLVELEEAMQPTAAE